jgi:ribose transport system substrate-binding protein
MKRRLILFLATCVAAAVIPGTTAEAAKGKAPYIIFVNPLVGNPVFTSEENGLKKAAEEFGFKLKIIGPSTIDDTQMVQAVESAIAEKPDAIVTVPYNFSALENTYKKAASAGIPIINTSSDSPEKTRVCYVGTDNVKYGIMAADYIAQKTGGRANVAIMLVRLDISNQLAQKKAFEARLAEKYPNINVIITEQDAGDAMTALQKFQDIFKAHPQVDTVLCLDSICCNSAALVVAEMNLIGKVTILAIDDNDETIANIKSGRTWATMTQNFFKMGYLGGKYAMDTLKGKKVPSTTDSGTVLVTKDNLATYKAEMMK